MGEAVFQLPALSDAELGAFNICLWWQQHRCEHDVHGMWKWWGLALLSFLVSEFGRWLFGFCLALLSSCPSLPFYWPTVGHLLFLTPLLLYSVFLSSDKWVGYFYLLWILSDLQRNELSSILTISWWQTRSGCWSIQLLSLAGRMEMGARHRLQGGFSLTTHHFLCVHWQ